MQAGTLSVERADTKVTRGTDTFPRATLQGASVIALRFGAAGLAFVAQLLAARMLGAEQFGRYSLMLVWLLVLGYLATAGSGQLICRKVSQYAAAEDRKSAAGLLRAGLAAVLAVAIFIASVAIATISFGPFDLDENYILLGALALSAIPLVALQDYLESIARGLDRPALGIGPAFLVRHLAVIAGLGALLALGREATALTVMGFTIAGLFGSVVIQYLLLQRHVRQMLNGARPQYKLAQWVKTALPMAGTDITEMLLLNADILILGLFVEPELVAYYFAATRLAQILAYVPYGATAATAQKYAALAAPADRAELQSLIGKTATLATAATATAALVLALLAGPLLSLFGHGYAVAAPAVAVLSLGILLSCAFGPGEDVLNMLGEERLCSLGFLIALAVNIALNFALIPHFGIMGAAVATVSALALRGALLAYFARVRLGLVLPAVLSLVASSHGREVPREA
jgi:O-antigen/teichoic acid export membrane protein